MEMGSDINYCLITHSNNRHSYSVYHVLEKVIYLEDLGSQIFKTLKNT